MINYFFIFYSKFKFGIINHIKINYNNFVIVFYIKIVLKEKIIINYKIVI